ncbi:MAG: hypothetical protein JWQ20_4080 [Conexibacter sp.]|nr:hypothetical protein [Conexibacter sp.]
MVALDTATAARDLAATSGVLQRVVHQHGAVLSADVVQRARASEIVRSLAADRQSWYLADDAKLGDRSVRALGRKRYLLGELHDRSEWAAQVAAWTTVRKLDEGGDRYRTEGEDRPDVRVRDADERAVAPLEDLDAKVLEVALHSRQLVLAVHNILDSWRRLSPAAAAEIDPEAKTRATRAQLTEFLGSTRLSRTPSNRRRADASCSRHRPNGHPTRPLRGPAGPSHGAPGRGMRAG